MSARDDDGGYVFDLQIISPERGAEDGGTRTPYIDIRFYPPMDGDRPEVVVKSNMPVADVERGVATALEALDNWWEEAAPQAIAETPNAVGERDDAFVDRVWTPYADDEGDI